MRERCQSILVANAEQVGRVGIRNWGEPVHIERGLISGQFSKLKVGEITEELAQRDE